MKNIKLISEQDSTLQYGADRHCPGPLDGDHRVVTATALVSHDLSDRVFVTLTEGPVPSDHGEDPRKVVVASVLTDGTVDWHVDVLKALEPEELPVVVPSALLALDINNDALTVGLSTGHILSVDIETRHVSEVGCIEGGIAGLQYSPDGELVALVSGLGQLIIMTSEWDVLLEVCAVDVRCDAPQATAVAEDDALRAMCAGRDARDGAACGGLGGLGASDVGVTWRGDGKYVATCVRCGADDQSTPIPGRLRIWDVESLSLHAIGEQSPGMLPVLAWQPNGRTLCVANSLSDDQVEELAMLRLTKQEVGGQGQAPEVRHVGAWKRELRRRQEAAIGEATGPSRVFIYERNGLQHGEFVVPGDGMRIEQMAWSGDSRTLAVLVCGDEGTRSAQIWCRSNWKWYNKWTRTFDSGERVLMTWHEGTNGATLTMLTAKSTAWVVSRCKLAWDYDVSEYGTVTVVNGPSALITPMRQCTIPPPLCAVELVCGRPIVCVLSSRTGDGREMIGALLDNGCLAIATCHHEDDWESTLEDQSPEENARRGGPSNRLLARTFFRGAANHQYRHAAFLGSEQVVLVGQSTDGVDSLFHYSFSLPNDDVSTPAIHANTNEGHLHLENCVELESHVSRLVRYGNSGVLFEFEDGRCKTYTAVDRAVVGAVVGAVGRVGDSVGFGTPCDVIRVFSMEERKEERHGDSLQNSLQNFEPSMVGFCVMGLDLARGRLYRNGTLLASDATSVGIHCRSSGGPHLLYTTRNNVLKTLPLFGEMSDAISRTIEDGCVLVSLPEGSVDVVMQAPRGNLEIIRPRALVLPAVHGSLDVADYSAAWRLATINRVDMNVLVNHGWPKLLENIRAFMEGVGSDAEVAGFLQSLEVHDDSDGSTPGRLQQVCEAFRTEVAGRRAWLRTELTTHTKCGDIGKALLRVKEIKEIDMNENPESTSQPSAEIGLKHILLHNNENAVYEAALGEYELQLAYMVVAHIQRDPGEYLAQLQEFAVIESQRMRQAAIDKHLGRFDKAVENLFEAGSFDDALELAVSKGLLRHLLALVDACGSASGQDIGDTSDSLMLSKRSIVLKALGEHLSTKGKYEDAALAYVAAGDLEQALRSYRLASAWRPAMTLAFRLGKDDAFVRDLARRLCDDLEEFQPVEAARIHLDYLNNLPVAVRLFAQGGEWREALRLALGMHLPFLESTGDPGGDNHANKCRPGNQDGGAADNLERERLMEILVSVASASASRLLDGFIEDLDRVDKYWSRLRNLREKRVAMESIESEREHQLEDDAFVDTASMTTDMSMFSVLTDATAASTSTFASFASTVGGRRKAGKRQGKKKNKIRRGSPEEEDQLAGHIMTLLPKTNVCEECGQLSEFLVYIGHEDDAIKLQSSLKALIEKASAAADDILAFPPPRRQMVLPYGAREGIFNEAGPATLVKIDRHVANVADAELQVQVQEGKKTMLQTGWKWEMLRRA